jgi:hypothetical protein
MSDSSVMGRSWVPVAAWVSLAVLAFVIELLLTSFIAPAV